MVSKVVYTGLVALSSISGAFAAIDSSLFSLFEFVEKDVVIVGGGAAGSQAAVRLREDYNKTIMLIEQQSILVNNMSPALFYKLWPC